MTEVNREEQLEALAIPDLQSELIKVAKTGLQPYGYDNIDFRTLVMGARRMGWEYIPGAYSNEDERVARYSTPAPMNELTLMGTLKYQLGYDYAGTELPALPTEGSDRYLGLAAALREVGIVLEELYSRDPNQFTAHPIPPELFRQRKLK